MMTAAPFAFLALTTTKGTDYSRFRCLTSPPRRAAAFARDVLRLKSVKVAKSHDGWSVIGAR